MGTLKEEKNALCAGQRCGGKRKVWKFEWIIRDLEIFEYFWAAASLPPEDWDWDWDWGLGYCAPSLIKPLATPEDRGPGEGGL